jgi:hypothetical protein
VSVSLDLLSQCQDGGLVLHVQAAGDGERDFFDDAGDLFSPLIYHSRLDEVARNALASSAMDGCSCQRRGALKR